MEMSLENIKALLQEALDPLNSKIEKIGGLPPDKVWFATGEVGAMMKPPRISLTVANNCRRGYIKAEKVGQLKQDVWRIHRSEVTRLLSEGYRKCTKSPTNQ